MKLPKVLLAGVAGGVVNAVYSILVCTHLIIPWVKKLTPSNLWVPETGFFMPMMVIYGFSVCILWAFGYALLYKGIPGSGLNKGIIYGFLLWLLGLLPNTVALHLHTTIWPEFNWVFLTVNNLIRWVILGIVYATIYKVE